MSQSASSRHLSIKAHTHHCLCADLPVSLNVPEAKGAYRRRNGLRETEIGILQEREAEFVILTNGDERASCVEALESKLEYHIHDAASMR